MANKQAKPSTPDTPNNVNADQDPSQQDNAPKASGHGGKVENDHNQMGDQKPTQKNEGQRTANSRHDRESHVGGGNQLQSRKGTGGGFGR